MPPEDNTPNLLSQIQQIQQLCQQIAAYPIRQTSIQQLKRDLCTLRGNLYLAEIKISQAEESLQHMKQRRIKLIP